MDLVWKQVFSYIDIKNPELSMIFVICKYRLEVYLRDGWNKKPATSACSDIIGQKIDTIIDNQNYQTNKCT
jgi:hypothetical protein